MNFEEILIFCDSEKIEFSMLSARDIERMSCVEIVHNILYETPGKPFTFGPLDQRLVDFPILRGKSFFHRVFPTETALVERAKRKLWLVPDILVMSDWFCLFSTWDTSRQFSLF